MEDEKQKNLEYLKNDIKYLGFGENLKNDLEQNLNNGHAKFQLRHQGEFKRPGGEMDKMDVLIDFNKSERTGRYFLNSYTATLKNENDPTLEKSQTFYINKGHGVTAKEAYNLLNGRSVYKKQTNREGDEYHAWIQLDFNKKETNGNFKQNQFHDNYGYNLAETLLKYPIKELHDLDATKDLVDGLKKGNLQRATFEIEGKEEKMFLAANPQFKMLRVYDSTLKEKSQGVESSKKLQEPAQPKEQHEEKKETKEKVKPGDDDGPGEGKKKKKNRIRV